MPTKEEVMLRKAAEERGKQVDYNPDTRNVYVDGQQYTPDALRAAGGRLEGGHWQVPSSFFGAPAAPPAGGGEVMPEGAAAPAAGAPPAAEPYQYEPFDQGQGMDQLSQYLQQFTDGHLQQQQAALESHKHATIAELRSQYEAAIAEGKISVRDAEAQFQEQVKEIEQHAYHSAQRTALHGHEMGLQNSQQMAAMMQGDQARTRGLHSENMSERDQRINNIRDRMEAIRQQKVIGVDKAKADYRTGLMGAEAEASMMYGQGMFDLKRDDLSAQRDQHHAMQQLGAQDHYQRGQMELQDHHTRGQMGLQHEFSLAEMAEQHGFDLNILGEQHAHNLERDIHQSGLRIEEMVQQHGMDMEKIMQSFQNDFSLQQLVGSQRMAQISAQGAQQIAAARAGAEAGLQRDLTMLAEQDRMRRTQLRESVTPGTDMYKAAELELDRELERSTSLAYAQAGADFTMSAIMNDPFLVPRGSEITKPKDYRDVYGGITGNILNTLRYNVKERTSYDNLLDQFQREQAAAGRAEDFIGMGRGPNLGRWAEENEPEWGMFSRWVSRQFPNTK